jgi:hypothetical protein
MGRRSVVVLIALYLFSRMPENRITWPPMYECTRISSA